MITTIAKNSKKNLNNEVNMKILKVPQPWNCRLLIEPTAYAVQNIICQNLMLSQQCCLEH